MEIGEDREQAPSAQRCQFTRQTQLVAQRSLAARARCRLKRTQCQPQKNITQILMDGARAQLEVALRLDPSYRTAHENLGDVFMRLALRAFESAAGPRSEAALLNKLRLARELAALR